jgi:RNA recognition motif-containing protein
MNNTNNSTVYISNLSYQRDRNGLKSIFSKFGAIRHIKIIVEPKSGQSRGMAFVEMATPAQAKLAIESLNQQIIDRRTVKASWAIPERIVPAKKVSEEKPKNEKDLAYKDMQLAKKARNDAKRKSNPFIFKVKSK